MNEWFSKVIKDGPSTQVEQKASCNRMPEKKKRLKVKKGEDMQTSGSVPRWAIMGRLQKYSQKTAG